MAVHGAVPQPGRAGGSGTGDGRSLQRPQRRAELKALDKARSADPDWYKRGNMFGMTIKFAFSELDFASVLLRSPPCAAFSALFGCQLRILGFQLFRAGQLGEVVCLEIGCCRPVRCQLCTMLLLKGC